MNQLIAHDHIKGLFYCPNLLSTQEEKQIIEQIYKNNWMNDLRRHVQHYGYRYDYLKRRIDKNDWLGELPVWSNILEKRIFDLLKARGIGLPYDKFDQIIVNEYKAGQGIGPHIDCVPCFRNGIVTVTIGNSGVMTFTNAEAEYDVKLEQRSVAILTDEARYQWAHQINPKKNSNFTDDTPRISLTFRKCILN